jgi:hypothetical protein
MSKDDALHKLAGPYTTIIVVHLLWYCHPQERPFTLKGLWEFALKIYVKLLFHDFSKTEII